MKLYKSTIFLLFVLLLIPALTIAQQKYHVHEDVVKPSKTMEYETVLKEIMGLVKENPIENLNMFVFQGNNNHYYFVEAISSMADLDKPSPLSRLAEKVGREKIIDIVNRLDQCYDVEKDYILTLNNELSYMPNGLTPTVDGQNYREQYKIYVSPSNRAIVREKLKAVKNLYTSKKSTIHYRVYESGFGTESEYYLVSIAAKDDVDMATRGKANEDVLGEERKKIMFELFQNVQNIEEFEGEMRPDLSIETKK